MFSLRFTGICAVGMMRIIRILVPSLVLPGVALPLYNTGGSAAQDPRTQYEYGNCP